MSMREADHGGPIKSFTPQPSSNDAYVFETITSDYDTLPTVDRGGILPDPETQNYKGIETPATPNIAHNAMIYPSPSVSGLQIDHGGPIKQKTIVNDSQ